MKYLILLLGLSLFACSSETNQENQETTDSPELEEQELQKVQEMLKRDQEVLDSMMKAIKNDTSNTD